MFSHVFTYRIKCLLRDKSTIFWSLIFPMLLAVFFTMSLSNMNKYEAFETISIAVVDDEACRNDKYFRAALEEASIGERNLFNLEMVTEDIAKELLESNIIKGYIKVDNPIRLIVKESGISQDITRSFIDDYMQTMSLVTSLLDENPEKRQELFERLGSRINYTKEVSAAGAAPNNILNYFYSLIAMACFYGAFFGLREITDIQADLSALAARVNVAPLHKMKTFIYSMCAALIIHFIQMLLMLAFLRFVLSVDFGGRLGFVLLTMAAGSITGVSFGAFISALVKKSENFKIAILISVSMTGSFLAGMMYYEIRYIIMRNAPALSYLNPVNVLTDALYCLYYYDTGARYALNMGILCIFTTVFCAGSYLMIRRRRYTSI